MNIRRAALSDAHTLSRLNLDVQRLHARALPHLFKPPPGEDFALQFMREQLADSQNYFFICQHDGEDVGYIFARIIERPENSFFYGWKYLYIDHISVRPCQRGRGFGRKLMETVYELAKIEGLSTIALETWAFNQDAQAFFRQVGFETTNIRMWRQVTPP